MPADNPLMYPSARMLSALDPPYGLSANIVHNTQSKENAHLCIAFVELHPTIRKPAKMAIRIDERSQHFLDGWRINNRQEWDL